MKAYKRGDEVQIFQLPFGFNGIPFTAGGSEVFPANNLYAREMNNREQVFYGGSYVIINKGNPEFYESLDDVKQVYVVDESD